MKRILLIGTGGTIASEMTEDGLAPKLGSNQLLNYIPRVSEICDVDCFQLMSVDSTNGSTSRAASNRITTPTTALS